MSLNGKSGTNWGPSRQTVGSSSLPGRATYDDGLGPTRTRAQTRPKANHVSAGQVPAQTWCAECADRPADVFEERSTFLHNKRRVGVCWVCAGLCPVCKAKPARRDSGARSGGAHPWEVADVEAWRCGDCIGKRGAA